MKQLTAALAVTGLSILLATDSFAANIVGYYNEILFPGDNLIANQLDSHSTNGVNLNFLNSLLSVNSGGITAGTTFTKWDSAGHQFLPVSLYDGESWSINYSLNFGEGGLLHTTSRWTNIFVGTVYPATWLGGTEVWQPNYADGLHLISSPVPLAGNMNILFTNVVGRLPQEGEWVRALDAATQTYNTATFHSGTGWDNLGLTLQVGQAAWFNLGASVPEPATASLVGTALLMAAWQKRRVRSNQ